MLGSSLVPRRSVKYVATLYWIAMLFQAIWLGIYPYRSPAKTIYPSNQNLRPGCTLGPLNVSQDLAFSGPGSGQPTWPNFFFFFPFVIFFYRCCDSSSGQCSCNNEHLFELSLTWPWALFAIKPSSSLKRNWEDCRQPQLMSPLLKWAKSTSISI